MECNALRPVLADCYGACLQQAAVAASVRNRDDYQAVVDPEAGEIDFDETCALIYVRRLPGKRACV